MIPRDKFNDIVLTVVGDVCFEFKGRNNCAVTAAAVEGCLPSLQLGKALLCLMPWACVSSL